MISLPQLSYGFVVTCDWLTTLHYALPVSKINQLYPFMFGHLRKTAFGRLEKQVGGGYISL